MPPPENLALRIEQARVLVDGRDARLNEATIGVRPGVDVALRPCVDGHRAARDAGEEDRPVRDTHGGGDVGEPDVVQNERAAQAAVARLGALKEGGRVGHNCIDDRFAGGALVVLRRTAGGDLETELAIVDVDTWKACLHEEAQ